MKIFIIHYKKLYERKLYLLKQFVKYNLTNFKFIDIDRDELHNYDLSIFDLKKMPNVNIAVLLSHIEAYKEIANNLDYGLIIEDDAIFDEDFINKLNKYMDEVPKDYDMLFIGDGCNLHIPQNMLIEGTHIYKKSLESTSWGGNGATRCVAGYIVNKKCSIQLFEYLKNMKNKIDLPIDWWLNNYFREKHLNIYWAEPTIIFQGSENGSYNKSY